MHYQYHLSGKSGSHKLWHNFLQNFKFYNFVMVHIFVKTIFSTVKSNLKIQLDAILENLDIGNIRDYNFQDIILILEHTKFRKVMLIHYWDMMENHKKIKWRISRKLWRIRHFANYILCLSQLEEHRGGTRISSFWNTL